MTAAIGVPLGVLGCLAISGLIAWWLWRRDEVWSTEVARRVIRRIHQQAAVMEARIRNAQVPRE